MSWAEDGEPTREFAAQADRNFGPTKPFSLHIWESAPAPLDLPQHGTKTAFLALFKALGVPQAFIKERLQSADYSWRRSGFFLSVDNTARAITLCCFGAGGKVEDRLNKFLKSSTWKQALEEPYVLLDIVLDGLYSEVDDTVWNMNSVFGALEHRLLLGSTSRGEASTSKVVTFAELHNVAKHIIHLREAVESSLLLTEGINRRIKEEEPLYLSFNLLSVSDSSILLQHSSVNKVIAGITIVFLPTTAVAAIMGSNLFESMVDDGGWTIRVSPLFGHMWAVALPLTLFVLVCAALLHWNTHRVDEKEKGASTTRRSG
ncbi:hypothetical protein QBC43DRAFT_379090 [Cladorrhinum sp. PSN259]|nr:hypothetical protein QBC43DRAFT_379090 [Cladorrhinum sp. PSN259]